MRRGSRRPGVPQEARRRIAAAAARLISDSGLRDYRMARDKAAAQLGIHDHASLPDVREIEEALREHQRLFGGELHLRTLAHLRAQALAALRFFADHEPRLVGAVLDGTADAHSAVCLHLHTERPLAVLDLLTSHGIDFRQSSRRLRFDHARNHHFPTLRFAVEDITIDVTLMPYDLLRQAPLADADGKPMQRATLAALERLLTAEPPAGA